MAAGDHESGATDPSSLERGLGYSFTDRHLLDTALTHRSVLHEGGIDQSYERLEFLGDAVLGLATTAWLFRGHPEQAEGELSRLKSRLVSAEVLARYAEVLGIGPCLHLGRGEERSGGRERESILADAFEAIVGAVFIESGFDEARRVVERLLESTVTMDHGLLLESKNRLQEELQSRGIELPEYVVQAESGPDHDKCFQVDVLVEGEILGSGTGSSKKRAGLAAAAAALEILSAGAVFRLDSQR